jgi:hypothetical protein
MSAPPASAAPVDSLPKVAARPSRRHRPDSIRSGGAGGRDPDRDVSAHDHAQYVHHRKISRAFGIVSRNPRRRPGASGRIPKLSHRILPREFVAVAFNLSRQYCLLS